MPTAALASGALVKSNAPIVTRKPLPSPPTTFCFGTITFSNVTPRVSEARCPIICSLRPRVKPGFGSVRANTKNQFATPQFMIQTFSPFKIQSPSAFFSALVLTPATSDPAPGSVIAYAAEIFSDVQRPKYSFFC
ncbi:hypothetical protein BLOT_013975 [Blomia tropicalis]|nr:hypothetical protein BLOT_013975 [Blomia tropicalis]